MTLAIIYSAIVAASILFDLWINHQTKKLKDIINKDTKIYLDALDRNIEENRILVEFLSNYTKEGYKDDIQTTEG